MELKEFRFHLESEKENMNKKQIFESINKKNKIPD
jgi:hypothetical protein